MAENHLPQGDDVAQQENNGFGPLFKRRGKTATYTSAIAVVIISAMLFFTVKGKEKEFPSPEFTIALQTLSVVLGEMIRRLFLVSEEFKHISTRYRGDWKRIFKATFTNDFCMRSLLAAIVSTFIICCHQLYEGYEILSRPDLVILFFLNSLLVGQLSYLVGLRQLSPVETSDLIEKENKNVADGLAWGYYFGYLKLVLPKLKDQIGKSELFRYEITKKKLFILLPKTCYTCADIVEADSRVKWVGHLPELKISRGGIKERIYKHSVHKIEMPRPDGAVERYHFILEYATPLMNLYDMSEYADAPFNREERDHQVGQFLVFSL